MRTKTLVNILEPLRPCGAGINLALNFRTVKQWFNSPRVPLNHKMYVWLCVACADSDNVFAKELVKFNRAIMGYKLLTKDIVYARNHLDLKYGFPLDYIGAGQDAEKFNQTFRCPTDDELRLIGKWIKKHRK